MELDPVVIGILSIIGAGMIFAVIVVTLCSVCNKYCQARHTQHCEHSHSELGNHYNSLSNSQEYEERDSITNERKYQARTKTLKDSVLLGEAPPTYQVVTEYPRVYAGQYYIGMSGGNDSEVQPWLSWNVDHLDEELPPDYHLVAPI